MKSPIPSQILALALVVGALIFGAGMFMINMILGVCITGLLTAGVGVVVGILADENEWFPRRPR